MGKYLYIAEKPSVANEFAKALKRDFRKRDGYLEAEDSVVTWCVGHLVTMSYPESYNPVLKKWSLDTIPFLPAEFKYEIIPAVAKQFNIVKDLLNRADVERIYVCTDSGREGEYIYRLVDKMAGVPANKDKRRVWIDSQTEEEVLRGIREAKPISAYDNLSDAAYLRAKEDYLMGINFSRVLTLKYGYTVKDFLNSDKSTAISVGRVMTCVLGMVVRREREIRSFVKTPFYRVITRLNYEDICFDGEFRTVPGSRYHNSPVMYKENGFKEKITAERMIAEIQRKQCEEISYETLDEKSPAYRTYADDGFTGEIVSIEKKRENKNAPLLFNLAELQNECSKLFKISPDETLSITQELYEKKLVTYPRTDARVLSTAVSKEITKNISGLKAVAQFHEYAEEILVKKMHKGLAKTRYVNDKQITDHYAIIPTGQGLNALGSLKAITAKVYELIGRRFLSIFYPPAVYRKISLVTRINEESFFSSFKVLAEEGWLKVADYYKNLAINAKKNAKKADAPLDKDIEIEKNGQADSEDQGEQQEFGTEVIDKLEGLKKGMSLNIKAFTIRTSETAPPKRYNSGSLILAMENAGQLIEDDELRAQIKGSGIGTSATRAEILNKLVKITYLNLNRKTQIITPALMGEMIFDVVNASIKSLLNPELTASWEKGLTYVAEGSISEREYMMKLESFVSKMTNGVKELSNKNVLLAAFRESAKNYRK